MPSAAIEGNQMNVIDPGRRHELDAEHVLRVVRKAGAIDGPDERAFALVDAQGMPAMGNQRRSNASFRPRPINMAPLDR
jgi:hypothetical protein